MSAATSPSRFDASSAISSSQTETDLHLSQRATSAHRRACSRVARTVNVATLRLRSGFGGVMGRGGGFQTVDAHQLGGLGQGEV